MRYLTEEHGYMSLQDEATLIACQKAAKQGVLMAQVALAQFYSTSPARQQRCPQCLPVVFDRQ